MKVSLNWIKFINEKYGTSANPIPDGVDVLVKKIGEQLGAVEEVIDLGKKYKGIIVVKVLTQQKHPKADKLNIVLVDDGGAVKGVNRNKAGYIQVVHGASNVRAGMLVAWIPPGSTVPATFDKEPFVIEARELRGLMSNGMLASAKELALGDDHSGILEIDEPVKAGTAFAQAVALDDYIIDIENKMFTHRPDLFGILGIARELAGIQGHNFKSPSWYRTDAKIAKSNARETHKLAVKNEVPKLVPRFSAVVIKDLSVKQSPLWLRITLSSVGIRPINNIVDITNFFMYETAQPLHAYDYDKLETGVLGVRLSKKGEKLKLLGGKEIKLDSGAVVITDGKSPIGLGGVMGGADTEVDENTKTIILESANFDMNITRQTAMKYGLFTDAATRFTKNQSPLQTKAVLVKAIEDTMRVAGGRISGAIIDNNHVPTVAVSRGNLYQPVKLTVAFINERLGLELSAGQISKLLQNVEFKVEVKGDYLTTTAPFWRTDIEIPEDIVEEVGRLYGYSRLPVNLPKRDLTPAEKNELLEFKSVIRRLLVKAGANEVLTYSFMPEKLLQAVKQRPEDSFHIRNAISPELQFYRQSLVSSLLEKVHSNARAGYSQFALFEIGKVHIKGMLDRAKIPLEFDNLALVITSKQVMIGAPYYAAKNYLEFLLNRLGVDKVSYSQERPRSEVYEPKRSAWIYVDDELLGAVGEPSGDVGKALKLPDFTAQFEINLAALQKVASPRGYRPLNRYPSIDQDLTLKTKAGSSYAETSDFLSRRLDQATKQSNYNYQITPLGIYQRQNDKSHKQVSWRIRLWHPERTLTTKETNKLLDKIAKDAKQEVNAERV